MPTTTTKPPFTEAQRELWKQVRAYVLEEPRRLNMNIPLRKLGRESGYPDKPPCNTVGCLAGSAVFLNALNKGKSPFRANKEILEIQGEDLGWDKVRRKAADLLGLSLGECNKVFQVDYSYAFKPGAPSWPDSYRRRYKAATSPEGRAKVAAKLIDRILRYGVNW